MTSADLRFRLGVYVFDAAELLDFAGPCGIFSIASHLDAGLEVVLIGETRDPVDVLTGVTVVPGCTLDEPVAIDALLLPGGRGVRREMNNLRLHRFIRSLPPETILASVCAGVLVLGQMGLLDGQVATSRREPDPDGFSFSRSSLLDELSQVAPTVSVARARLVDNGRIITSGGAAAGLDLGFHLLLRAGLDEAFVSEVARVMDYTLCYEAYLGDVERVVPT